jgi:hypothetical protein
MFTTFGLIRYDPSERFAKGRRMQEAARQIARGVPPEETGVPGIGVRPGAGRVARARSVP